MAAWSPAATPRRVWPSMMRAVRADDRDVRQDARHQPCADGRPVDGRHDRLGAVDHVEDEVPGLAHDPGPHGVVGHQVVEHLEAPARREGPPGALQQRDGHVGVAVDGEPHVGQLAVHGVVDGVEAGGVERDPQHPVRRPVEPQVGEGVGVAVGHRASLGGRERCDMHHEVAAAAPHVPP